MTLMQVLILRHSNALKDTLDKKSGGKRGKRGGQKYEL